MKKIKLDYLRNTYINEEMHDITKLLEQIQESNELTNYGLAKAIGASPQYLYRLIKEPFLVNPTVASKIAICNEIDPLEVIASIQYQFGDQKHKDFWKTIYFKKRCENWKIEYTTGGFYIKPWYMC